MRKIYLIIFAGILGLFLSFFIVNDALAGLCNQTFIDASGKATYVENGVTKERNGDYWCGVNDNNVYTFCMEVGGKEYYYWFQCSDGKCDEASVRYKTDLTTCSPGTCTSGGGCSPPARSDSPCPCPDGPDLGPGLDYPCGCDDECTLAGTSGYCEKTADPDCGCRSGDGCCGIKNLTTGEKCSHKDDKDCPVVILCDGTNLDPTIGVGCLEITEDYADGAIRRIDNDNFPPNGWNFYGAASSISVADEYMAVLYTEDGHWTEIVASDIVDLSKVGATHDFDEVVTSIAIKEIPGVTEPPVILHMGTNYSGNFIQFGPWLGTGVGTGPNNERRLSEDLAKNYFDGSLRSIEVDEDYRVTLFEKPNFEGWQVEGVGGPNPRPIGPDDTASRDKRWFQLIATDSPDLGKNSFTGTFVIFSIIIQRTGEKEAPVTLYKDVNYGGNWIQLAENSNKLYKQLAALPSGWTCYWYSWNKWSCEYTFEEAYTSSIKVAKGYVATIYSGNNYGGKWIHLTRNSKNLKLNGTGDAFHDNLRSIKITRNTNFPPAPVTLYQKAEDCVPQTGDQQWLQEPAQDWIQLTTPGTFNLADHMFKDVGCIGNCAVEVAPGYTATVSDDQGNLDICNNVLGTTHTKCCLLDNTRGTADFVTIRKETVCGNGIVEGAEDCDCGPDHVCQGDEWGQYDSCEDAGLGTGTWSCCLPGSTDCTPCRYDARGCSGAAQECGDGEIDIGEVCDDNNTPDDATDDVFPEDQNTCGEVKPGTVGTLKCVACTTINSDGCQPLTCNNDGTCQATETNSSCPNDCYCGNGTCDLDENENSCPTDCGVVSAACYPPDCCQLNTETALALTEGGANAAYTIISKALDECKPGNNWMCEGYTDRYPSKKACKPNCVVPASGFTGPPACYCAEPFPPEKVKEELEKITAIDYKIERTCWQWTIPWINIDINVDPLCWVMLGMGAKPTEDPNDDPNRIILQGSFGAGEALWEWILKPFIASKIKDYSALGAEGCDICITREGEIDDLYHPAIHIPTNFCIFDPTTGDCLYTPPLSPSIPVIGGMDIQLAPGLCVWLYNMGYTTDSPGRWGQIWVNLNPFVKAETLEELITNIVNFLLLIGLPLAFLFFIIGGIMFMTAAGNPDRVNLAKRIIFYAAIGLIIIIFAKGLVELIKRIVGG